MQMRNKLMIMTLGHEETRARARALPRLYSLPAVNAQPAVTQRAADLLPDAQIASAAGKTTLRTNERTVDHEIERASDR